VTINTTDSYDGQFTVSLLCKETSMNSAQPQPAIEVEVDFFSPTFQIIRNHVRILTDPARPELRSGILANSDF
jgi:hypothetical protein